ncbi:hemagglutinin repeat-containing protein [Pseudomonas sp. BP8]|uniref:hemagglutinin repeat-containing protein n=1 Tax=Pseudomonas sp. BP8 TaxID=2817864 RepID=UPI001AE7D360|nr:hemagglutinin repeat-containing protein [Pseudomonas sp. BP8]MBP2260775.1 hemolysin [Pseudomonas sp. BP8]HDS1735488.1 hemagglutinin repeat-containing protein [Pseudomonas putida]
MPSRVEPTLIRPDTLRWAIFLGLFSTCAALAQGPLQPITGPGGTPVINPGHGVPVIDIVAPNASGLSHNQFLDYNVGKPGLVLNNAPQAGQSQLAGALAANPQFHGQAASTILNEVVSRNASLIEGPQEIFGRAADYILANPNGITLNGGSFINTTRAGFFVGTPQVDGQQLKFIDTLQGSGTLQVLEGGQHNDAGALDLIAPQIDSKGELSARDELNLTVGRNRIDLTSGEIVEHLPATASSIDARLFGAMRAGRIRVISTAEGAGVRMGAVEAAGRDGVYIRSAGDLLISSDRSASATLRSEHGKLELGADKDLTLRAVEAQAKQIEAKAGKLLTLDTAARERITREQQAWDTKAWFITTETYSQERTTTERTQQGTQLRAEDGIALNSAGDMKLVAATVLAGDELNLASGGALDIEAGVDSKRVEESIRHRKHLWRGDSDSNDYQETSKGSLLGGKQIVATAAGTITVQGSNLSSEGDSLLYSDKGSLVVKADQTTSSSTSHRSDSKLFGLLKKAKDASANDHQAHGSELQAQNNLRLASAEEMKIHGSKLKAGKQLQLDAKGDLLIESAESRREEHVNSHQRGFTASAEQTQQAQDGKPDSRQYKARVGYEVANTRSDRTHSSQQASELQAGTIDLRSDGQLQVNGSKVQASAGDLTITAKQTSLGVTRNEHDEQTTTTQSGAGLALTGGIDKLGSAFDGYHNRDSQTAKDSKVQRTQLQASGKLAIATDELVTEAARVDAGDTLQVVAKRIDNRAVHDTEERQHETDNWSASLGASLEYRDLTRPIERLVEGGEAQRFQQAATEDALAAPSVGGEMTVDHLKRLENQRRGYAQVGELSGASVQVKADSIDDQGTAWRANSGALRVDSGRHNMSAAADQQQHSVDRLAFAGELRVDSSTATDLNVRAIGKGDSLASQKTTETARVGSLYGKQGIQVQLGSDGHYEGSRLDGGDGGVSVVSAGRLTLAQATERSTEQSTQLDGNAWAKGGNRPGSTGGEVRGYLKHEQRQVEDGKAQVAQIDGKGAVLLSSAGDLVLEGTRIGSRAAKVGEVRLESAGVLQVKAASDSHQAHGSKLGGGLELAAKHGTTQGGAVGGHFNAGRLDESASQAVDARVETAGTLRVSSTAREDSAVHLQGLQASAKRIELNAENGGLHLEGSADRDQRNNLDVIAGAGIAKSTGATTSQGLHGRVSVAVDKRDNQTWNASNLRAEHVALNSAGDSRIEAARLQATAIDGNIGGDLHLASRKDRVDSLSVEVDGRVSREQNPQGYINALSALAGPAGGKVTEKVGASVGKADPSLSPTLKLELSHQQRDTVGTQTSLQGRDGIDLEVGGDAQLVGATLRSANGAVNLQAGSVTEQTLTGRDYRRDVVVDASNSPVDLGTALVDAVKTSRGTEGENALNLGLLRTSGHDRSEQWTAGVQGKPQR